MSKNLRIYSLMSSVLLAFLLYFSYQIIVEFRPLEIVFLDVGQGDSILIQKGTRQILIDGGSNGKTELAELGKYLPYFDREIEILIATHPDRDHIGGLADVARNYKIDKVLTTSAAKDTTVCKEWRDVLDFKKIENLEAMRGVRVNFSGAEMKIIYPLSSVGASAGDANNDSVVARLDYGENSFLFTGDIEAAAEKNILKSGENIGADVMKVAHHGSRNSSTDEFLDAVSPSSAIISVGANNSYGHPHEETLNKLSARRVNVLRTDENGDIGYICKTPSGKCQLLIEKK